MDKLLRKIVLAAEHRFMLETLKDIDRELFIFLNGLHADWLDPVVYYLTNTSAWLPLYILLGWVIYTVYGKQSWLFLAGVAITILLSDQVTSSLLKPWVARLRPSHEPELKAVIHTVKNYLGGKYGFASSHAANTFGVATFLYLALRKMYPVAVLLFLWAFLVSYSRIYLGVHYPGDIIAGGLVGAGFGWLSYKGTVKLHQEMAAPPQRPTPRG